MSLRTFSSRTFATRTFASLTWAGNRYTRDFIHGSLSLYVSLSGSVHIAPRLGGSIGIN